MKPLQGIKVLDLTQFFSGPFCTLMMSDLGAEVIKFENPPAGDITRYAVDVKDNTSTNYTARNRGKKSVVLDLTDERQKAILFEMVKTADVIVSNYKTGTMEKLGIGYDVIKEINPRIVYNVC